MTITGTQRLMDTTARSLNQGFSLLVSCLEQFHPLLSSYSSALKNSPVVRIKVVVFKRSSKLARSSSCSVAPLGHHSALASLTERGLNCRTVGTVALSSMCSLQYVPVLVGTCVGAGGNVQSLGECFSVNVKAETPFPTPNCAIAIAPSETPAMLPLTQLCRIQYTPYCTEQPYQ